MRKALIAGAVATALFAVGAFAATFTVQSEDTASGSNAVESCATSATVDFTEEFIPANQNFSINTATVTLQGAADCNGADVQLVLQNNDGPKSEVFNATKSTIAHNVDGVVFASQVVTLTFTVNPKVPVANVWNAAILVDGKQLT